MATDERGKPIRGNSVLAFGQEDTTRRYFVLQVDSEGRLVLSPTGGGSSIIITQTAKIPSMIFTMPPFWSDSQLGVTIPAAAGTLVLPDVVVSGVPVGATIVKAKPIGIYRIVDNLNVALNKLNGATVAATSQVIQIAKGAGPWVDAINFIDDQFSIPGSSREGSRPIACSLDLSAVVTGNDTYHFRWLLARADLDSLYFQGFNMLIQLAFSLP
jgi:hypothetical protein